ncbi:MAG: hypothetical protein V1909_00965 [Candidatus Micrarchaeota archaeon]
MGKNEFFDNALGSSVEHMPNPDLRKLERIHEKIADLWRLIRNGPVNKEMLSAEVSRTSSEIFNILASMDDRHGMAENMIRAELTAVIKRNDELIFDKTRSDRIDVTRETRNRKELEHILASISISKIWTGFAIKRKVTHPSFIGREKMQV